MNQTMNNLSKMRRGGYPFILGIAFFLSPTLFGLAEQTAPLGASTDLVEAGNTLCPISGKSVSPKATAVYQGKRYAFCCQHCVAKFKKAPEKYLP